MKRWLILSAAAGVLLTAQAFATELTTNGDFSSFSSGNPTSWTYSQGDGPATLQNSGNSPFTNIYPAGTTDLLFSDGATAVTPNIIQSFANQSGNTIFASWDFNLASITNGQFWCVQIDNGASAATRFDMDFTGGTFAFEQNGGIFTTVTPLLANTWYQVTVGLNIQANTLSGTITPFVGSAVPFSGIFRQPAPNINRLVFIDINGGQDANIQLDNISVNTVAPVPEPATVAAALLAAGSVAFFSAKRIRRRVI